MARLFNCGFELNAGFTNDLEWTETIGSLTYDTVTVRSGTYSLKIASLSSGSRQGVYHRFVSAAASGPYFSRCYFNYATAPSAENRIITLGDNINFDLTPMVYITLNNSGALTLYDEDGQIGSASSSLSSGTWYYIELQFDKTAAAGSHVVNALINGVQFAGASNRSISAGIQTFNIGGNLNQEAQTTGLWRMEDVAINDSSGSFQNSYPGTGSIIHLRPNGNGDNSGWVGSDLNSTDNYLLVDEVTPNDATDTVGSALSGTIDDYDIEATPAAIGASDTITCVQVGVRFNAALAGSDAVFVLRIKASSGGTVEESSSMSPTTTTWNTNAVAAPKNYPLTLYDLPGASTTAWTKTDLDAAQIGQRVSTTGTNADNITAIWLSVDSTPAAASTFKSRNLSLLGVG